MTLVGKVNELKDKIAKMEREKAVTCDDIWKIEGVNIDDGDSSKECDLFVRINNSSLALKFTLFHGVSDKGEWWSCTHPLKTQKKEGKGYWYNSRIGGLGFNLSKKQIQDIESALIDCYKKFRGVYKKKELRDSKKNHDCSSCIYSVTKKIGMEKDSGKIESSCKYCVLKEQYLNPEFEEYLDKMNKRGLITKTNGSLVVRKSGLGYKNFVPKRIWEEDSLGVCRHHCSDYTKDGNRIIQSIKSGYTYFREEFVAEIPVMYNDRKIIIDATLFDSADEDDFTDVDKSYKWINKNYNSDDREYITVANINGDKIKVRSKCFEVKLIGYDGNVDREKLYCELAEVKGFLASELSGSEYKEGFIVGYPEGFDPEGSVWSEDMIKDKKDYYKQIIDYQMPVQTDYTPQVDDSVSYEDWMSGEVEGSEKEAALIIDNLAEKVEFKMSIEEKYGQDFADYDEMVEFLDNLEQNKINQKEMVTVNNTKGVAVEELTVVDGIGQGTVSKLVEDDMEVIYEDMTVEELVEVKGIAEATANKILAGANELMEEDNETTDKEVTNPDKEEVEETDDSKEDNTNEEDDKMILGGTFDLANFDNINLKEGKMHLGIKEDEIDATIYNGDDIFLMDCHFDYGDLVDYKLNTRITSNTIHHKFAADVETIVRTYCFALMTADLDNNETTTKESDDKVNNNEWKMLVDEDVEFTLGKRNYKKVQVRTTCESDKGVWDLLGRFVSKNDSHKDIKFCATIDDGEIADEYVNYSFRFKKYQAHLDKAVERAFELSLSALGHIDEEQVNEKYNETTESNDTEQTDDSKDYVSNETLELGKEFFFNSARYTKDDGSIMLEILKSDGDTLASFLYEDGKCQDYDVNENTSDQFKERIANDIQKLYAQVS
jgi:hypothetical protein